MIFFSFDTDGYNDPEDVIRKKREERLEREKIIRLEQEKKRQEILEKKRFRLPKIIITQHFDAWSRSQSAKSEAQSALPNLVNIPCGSDSERGHEESDTESQGSKGDRLELPELQSNIQEGFFEDISQADEPQNDLLLSENRNQMEVETDINDSSSQEKDLCADTENKSEKVFGDDVLQSEVAAETKSNPVSEELNKKDVDQNINQQIEEKTLDNSSHEQQEQYNAANKKGKLEPEEKENERRIDEKESERKVEEIESERKVEEKESERKVEEKESARKVQEKESETKVEEKKSKEKDNENEQEKKEIQMSYLVPPVAGKDGSDHGSIGDADETGKLQYCCFMR